jgi:hypothetical protein
MKQQNIPVKSLIDMIERDELQLPEMQRRYVWRAPRVRDLLDSLYRGYPSGSILVWETDAKVPSRGLQTHDGSTGQEPRKLLLDGQQRLTSPTAVLQGKPIHVRGRRRPIEILFNLDHPESLQELTEVEGDEESPLEEEDAEDSLPEEDEDGEESLLAARPPAEDLPKIVEEQGEAALHGQAIPLDPELHRVESYRRFLEVRRGELVRLMNEYLERTKHA